MTKTALQSARVAEPVKVFVLVPALDPSGPVKGAVALCNGLANHVSVTLVALKRVDQETPSIDSRVEIKSFAGIRSWLARFVVYRDLLKAASREGRVVSISFCLSADVFNRLMWRHATLISSVRGNLLQNYYFDYGWPGKVAAVAHLLMLRGFDNVVAMSDSMERQLRRYGIKHIAKIGNFIDETNLERARESTIYPRQGRVGFIFLASLSARKRPKLLLDAMRTLKERGVDCRLDIVGDGPLREELEALSNAAGLSERVIFHGHVANPYRLLQAVDCMVLPSRSEGVSRAVMEGLFFGVPCIMRDADAGREIITPGLNGALFAAADDLPKVMEKIARELTSGAGTKRTNLLPPSFRQNVNIENYLDLITQ